MHHLIDKLDRADSDNKIEGQIILIPVANPIGASKWRENMDSQKLSAKNSRHRNNRAWRI
jgi:predicted deacylase